MTIEEVRKRLSRFPPEREVELCIFNTEKKYREHLPFFPEMHAQLTDVVIQPVGGAVLLVGLH